MAGLGARHGSFGPGAAPGASNPMHADMAPFPSVGARPGAGAGAGAGAGDGAAYGVGAGPAAAPQKLSGGSGSNDSDTQRQRRAGRDTSHAHAHGPGATGYAGGVDDADAVDDLLPPSIDPTRIKFRSCVEEGHGADGVRELYGVSFCDIAPSGPLSRFLATVGGTQVCDHAVPAFCGLRCHACCPHPDSRVQGTTQWGTRTGSVLSRPQRTPPCVACARRRSGHADSTCAGGYTGARRLLHQCMGAMP